MTISNTTSQASRRIIELITDDQLFDGARLPSAQALAANFGISIIQVREALKYLESIGMLEISHGRGIFVRLRANVIDDLLEVRGMVECQCARVAARVRTAENMAELHELLEAMARATREEQFDDYTELDLRFHRKIASIAGNPIIGRILDNVRTVMQFHLLAINVERGVLRISMRVHEQIVALIGKGDADGAERAMRTHVSNISAKYHAHMRTRTRPRPPEGGNEQPPRG
jgi:GntR family transcriptional repressor for pyruvate dehydrogenase complex